jgi:molybdopterin-containing oxidoreductase family membrane subunit
VIAQAEVKTILKASGARYKQLRAEHGDDADHRNSAFMAEPKANEARGLHNKVNDDSKNNQHEETVNADALTTSEVQKDQLDQMLSRIGIYDPATETASDLTKLKAVGPLLQQRLHQVGIYTFAQVSKLESIDFELLNELIENFPSETMREDWIAQAIKLNNN